jgi:hypothetical protein
MGLENAKIYGLCLERLKHQIKLARARDGASGRVVLESYFTGDIDEIIDILELYDLEHRTPEALGEKLDDLAFTVSTLTRERLEFGYCEDGSLCLYVKL